jgi:peptidyl-prolyl cis-trans isomerase C
MFKRTIMSLIGMLFVFSVSLELCAANENNDEKAKPDAKTEEKAAAAEEKAPQPDPEPDKELAVLNGVKIMKSDVDARLIKDTPQLATAEESVKKQFMERSRGQMLDRVITEMLIDDKIQSGKIKVSDEDINKEVENIAQTQGMSMEELDKRLQEVGRSMKELKDNIQRGLAFKALIEKFAGEELVVSGEDIQEYYDENTQQFKQPEQVKASHILVKVEQDASEDDKAAAKAEIEEIKAKIDAGGDFAELAKAESDCPSGKNGGDLGFFSEGRMVKPFSDAAFAMEVGQISDVVETQFGYHIIKVTDKKEAKTQTFEEVKDNIKGRLEGEKRNKYVSSYIEKLKKEAQITYDEEYDPAKKEKPQQMQVQPKPAQ